MAPLNQSDTHPCGGDSQRENTPSLGGVRQPEALLMVRFGIVTSEAHYRIYLQIIIGLKGILS